MRYLIALATLTVALVASAAASAGGWATVGMSPLPDGTAPGETWSTRLTILQHGRTPLTGLTPTITISLVETNESETFVAKETDEAGVYVASVVFPEAGQWTVVADSTFGESRLTYGPVLIDAPATPAPTPTGAGGTGDEEGFPVLALVGVLAGLVVVAAAAFGLVRQRRLRPAG